MDNPETTRLLEEIRDLQKAQLELYQAWDAANSDNQRKWLTDREERRKISDARHQEYLLHHQEYLFWRNRSRRYYLLTSTLLVLMLVTMIHMYFTAHLK